VLLTELAFTALVFLAALAAVVVVMAVVTVEMAAEVGSGQWVVVAEVKIGSFFSHLTSPLLQRRSWRPKHPTNIRLFLFLFPTFLRPCSREGTGGHKYQIVFYFYFPPSFALAPEKELEAETLNIKLKAAFGQHMRMKEALEGDYVSRDEVDKGRKEGRKGCNEGRDIRRKGV
jgi:hypothetical protein